MEEVYDVTLKFFVGGFIAFILSKNDYESTLGSLVGWEIP